MEAAGTSLRHPEGHLYYLGARLFGVVGFIDSSEMVSTFGSSPYEVRGFVEGGWTTCQNSAGKGLHHLDNIMFVTIIKK